MKKFFILFFLFVSVQSLLPVTVGSNTAVSRQDRVFFPQADNDNAILGFTVLNNGFTLENSLTECVYDAFFHIAGDTVFNAGNLILNQNVEFKSPLQLGVGKITGNLFSVLFPDNLSILNLPTSNGNRLLVLKDQIDMGSVVKSVDWSWDDKYVAAVVEGNNFAPELQIFLLEDDCILTLTASSNVFEENNVMAVRWHPNEYMLAIGQLGLLSDQVRTFSFDVNAATLSQVDSDTGLVGVVAVSWSPDGNHVAVGSRLNTQIRVYPVSNGNLGAPILGPLLGDLLVQPNALSWDASGTYIAVGLFNQITLGSELQILEFNGATLVDAGTRGFNAAVNAVEWHPTDLILAVGHAGEGERIQLFEYNPADDSITLITTAGTGQQLETYSLSWSYDATYLLAGLDNAVTDNELEVYTFDTTEERLFKVATYSLNALVWSVRFPRHRDDLLVSGDSERKLSLFAFKAITAEDSDLSDDEDFAFIFENAKIFFKSDVILQGPILIKGSCIINSGNNSFDLGDNGTIVVDMESYLVLEDMILKGAADFNVRCKDSQSVLTLRDVQWQQDQEFTFTTGSIHILDDVQMSGDALFGYASSAPLVVERQSRFMLDQGFTFSYACDVPTLFQFEDETSQLVMTSASLVTSLTGLICTKGSLFVDGTCSIRSEIKEFKDENNDTVRIDEGIRFGDGTAENDFACAIFLGADLRLEQGTLIYNNVLDQSWDMLNKVSRLLLLPDTRLWVRQDLDLKNGKIVQHPSATIDLDPGVEITGPIVVRKNLK